MPDTPTVNWGVSYEDSFYAGDMLDAPLELGPYPHQLWSSTVDISNTVNFWSFGLSGIVASYSKQGNSSCILAVRAGHSQQARFKDNGDGTIIDNNTGLVWVQNPLDTNCRALISVENLVYAGHSDWRAANINELISIIDYNLSPAVDPVFPDYLSPEHESSTSAHYSETNDSIRHVSFRSGRVWLTPKEANGFLFWPVRAGP